MGITWSQIITPLLVAALTGVVGGFCRYVSKRLNEMKVSSKLTNYRLQQLENKVQEHNNYARRLPVVEEQIKVINHRVADLEAHEERRNA